MQFCKPIDNICKVHIIFRSKNYQSHDLGLDPLLDDDDEIKAAVEKLGTQLDFVMITDYMDESLILLKVNFRTLCLVEIY